MKTALQFLFLFFCAFSVTAQSNVKIQINHLLNGEVFEYNMDSKNDLDNDFNLERLEYYLSTFSVTHDGGQVSPIDDLYVLVNMKNKVGSTEIAPTIIDLGDLDIQNIESVNFYFGIDEEANHGDPSLWPIDHALAPKNPSMHWGWAAGYRFIALEGMSGPDLNQNLEFHCIGDEFYKEVSFPLTMSGNDTYEIVLDAEYSNLLSGIDISSGLIVHGSLGDIPTLSDNLKDKVFKLAEVTNTEDNELVKAFEVYPNPTSNGLISINVDVAGNNNVIQVYDAFGRNIQSTSANTSNIALTESGLYFLSLMDSKGMSLATRRVIVQ